MVVDGVGGDGEVAAEGAAAQALDGLSVNLPDIARRVNRPAPDGPAVAECAVEVPGEIPAVAARRGGLPAAQPLADDGGQGQDD